MLKTDKTDKTDKKLVKEDALRFNKQLSGIVSKELGLLGDNVGITSLKIEADATPAVKIEANFIVFPK